jgi:hypothetical protein
MPALISTECRNSGSSVRAAIGARSSYLLLSISSDFPHINPNSRLSGILGRMPIYRFGR